VNVLYAHLTKHAGATLPPRHDPPKPGEQRRSVLDYRKLQAVAKWTPTVSLEEGLRRTVVYFAEQLTRRKTT
jgi:UDP-glucose 4-epimerase